MHSIRITLLTIVLGVAGSLGLARANPLGGGKAHGPHAALQEGKDGRPAWRGFLRQRLHQRLRQFDANGDRKLDENERAAAREAVHEKLLERFDANGDGKLDDSEKPLLLRKIGHRLHERMKQFDANGDGQLDQTERAAAKESIHQKLLDRFDANHDGTIDDTERAAARDSIRKHLRDRFDAKVNHPE